jgi:mannosyltransferase
MIRKLLERLPFGYKKSWAEQHFTAILIIAAALFMTICMSIGLQQSVWFDEAYSIMLAKQPVDQLIHLTSIDTHPPLYYLLLKAWASLFGWSEPALRSLSVIAAGGAVVFAELLIKRLFNARAAIITLPFIVFAPFILRYGFEIRMYALASLIGIAATYVLVRAIEAKDDKRQWQLYILYAVLVALGVYTLYYTVVLWMAHLIWLVWLARSQKQPVMKQKWWLAFGGSVLLFAPWLPTFVSQLTNGALAPVSQPLTVDNLVGIVSFAFLYQPSWQLSAFLSLVLVFVIAAVACFAIKAFKSISLGQKPYLVLVALYLAVPIAIIALISLAKPMYVERYLAHVLIGGCLFVGIVTAVALQKANKKTWVAAGALVIAMLIGTMQLAQVGNYNFQRLQYPTIRDIAATIPVCEPGHTVLAADPYVAIELAYYLSTCDIHFYSEWPTLKGGYAPLSGSPLQVKDPIKELAASQSISYVYYDQPKLHMPETLRPTAEQSIGALHVATFNAE